MATSTRAAHTERGQRRPTNVSLDGILVDEARSLGINISQACERGIANQVAQARAERWTSENREAVSSSNAYIEAHGLPLGRHRLF